MRKILKATIFSWLSLLLLSYSLFLGISTVQAAQMNSEDDGENPMGIVIKESNKSQASSSANDLPDLGDDQAFPFIPGFGKYSSKN